MKVGLTIPPKFAAVFSKRVKILRDSLSQPISHSIVHRFPYATLSNGTERLSSRPPFLHGSPA